MKIGITVLVSFLTTLLTLAGFRLFLNHRVALSQEAQLNRSITESNLHETVRDIELYKVAFGFYPSTLKDLRGGFMYIDPSVTSCRCGNDSDFFYRRTDDQKSYELFSKGPDCQPFTSDDIAPLLSTDEGKYIGYRVASTPASNVLPSPTATKGCNGA